MEVYDAIRTVLAVRSYQNKPVPPEIVRQIIQAGRFTGSGMNSQPWHFVVVDDRDMLQQLGKLAPTGPYIAQAALAIVVVIERTPFAVSDATRAIQSMVLAAWAEGVGSNWVGFMGLDEVKPLLNIPADRDILAILPFGYPTETIKGNKKRKPLSAVASHGRFGQPYE